MTHHTEAERADFELMREAYEKAFGPPPVGAAWASVGYAIKTHEASEARAYADRFKGFVGGWVWRSAQTAPVPQGCKITEEQHVAAVKVLHRAAGVDGLPQRMLDAMLAAAPQPAEASTEESSGVVATVQMPEPEAYLYVNGAHRGVSLGYRGAMDLSVGTERHKLYTEQQVRQLLAQKG